MSHFEIHVARVPEGSQQYSFSARAEDLGLSQEFSSDVLVKADLERRGRQFLVSGACDTVGRFTCDRCLSEFQKEIGGSFRVLFVPEGVSGSSDQPETDDEVRTIPSDLLVIVLDEDVRQAVELTVPVKLLCRDECKGLCAKCGKNLNESPCACENDETDPRWEPLRKLSRS